MPSTTDLTSEIKVLSVGGFTLTANTDADGHLVLTIGHVDGSEVIDTGADISPADNLWAARLTTACIEHAHNGAGADASPVDPVASAESPHSPEAWKPFNYADFETGLSWLLVETPDVDVDVDDDGHTVGSHTGGVVQSVVLAFVEQDHHDGQVYFEAVDPSNFGRVPEDGVVTHYASVESPSLVMAAVGHRAPNSAGSQTTAHSPYEEMSHQIGLLGQALGECIAAAGITRPGAPLTGPELLMFADDLKQHLAGDGLSSGEARPMPESMPPFALKVISKLQRFEECASDFEAGGVDIGRHWLDLLTQLGLLNRVQRSPGLWEISQQGEDLLAAAAQDELTGDQARDDSQRFKKLLGWMSSNVKEGWDEVSRIASVATYVSHDEARLYIDGLPDCAAGLMAPPAPNTQEV